MMKSTTFKWHTEKQVEWLGIPGGKCSWGKSAEVEMSLGYLWNEWKEDLPTGSKPESSTYHRPVLGGGSMETISQELDDHR